MTNFDFLKQEPKFNSFSDVAIAAEKILKIDMESSVINCRLVPLFSDDFRTSFHLCQMLWSSNQIKYLF